MTSICGLITIVDRGKSAAVQKLYQMHQVNVSMILRGHGTANSEIMDMLGLDEPQKEVLLSVAHRVSCQQIFQALRTQLHFDRPGTGIAFTCNLSGISVAATGILPAGVEEQVKEENAMEAQPMEMILTVVDSGSTDVVVAAAKEAGAHGGTVLKAREAAAEEQKKIFGITVQPEKEIVLMLVPAEIKKDIFKAVCAAVLAQTGEHALVFSLPVSDTVGLKQ